MPTDKHQLRHVAKHKYRPLHSLFHSTRYLPFTCFVHYKRLPVGYQIGTAIEMWAICRGHSKLANRQLKKLHPLGTPQVCNVPVDTRVLGGSERVDNRGRRLTRFNKIAIQRTPQMTVNKEAISLSGVYSLATKRWSFSAIIAVA